MVKHIAFTMYPVKDMPRARQFYEGGLGLKLTNNFRDQWVEYHLNNGCFAITTMAEDVAPSANSGGSIAFEVDDVDVMVDKLRARKAVVKMEPFSTPVCRMAVVLDPEGNAISIHGKNPGR
ncbi:MAG: VOC family protein [Elusimicrobia bacterium]|nr:VOC family protein [Elusimicrobiota bacterium]